MRPGTMLILSRSHDVDEWTDLLTDVREQLVTEIGMELAATTPNDARRASLVEQLGGCNGAFDKIIDIVRQYGTKERAKYGTS